MSDISALNKLQKLAEEYAAAKNLKVAHNVEAAPVKVDRAKRIAEAYDQMKHDPNNPDVQRAYSALINETLDQFNTIRDSGLKYSKITPEMQNPYSTSADLMKDLHENNHIWYYPTESGFGSAGQTQDHPLLKMVDIGNGEQMPANDVFRIVHDYMGHGKEGYKFGAKGEEAAWRQHMQMFSPEAQKALTTETRGQNSWVNYGPHGEANRANPANTKYADQKAGLLPDWAYDQSLIKRQPTNPLQTLDQVTPMATKAYNMYNTFLEGLGNEAENVAGNIEDIVKLPVDEQEQKRLKEYNAPVRSAVNMGAQMALDPLNYVPVGKATEMGILARKDAARLWETAMKRAAEEGKSVGQVTSDMLLGKLPWGAHGPAFKNLEQQRLMMRDILGHALMEKGGIAEDKNLAKTIRSGVETLAPGFPSDKLMMVNPVGEISIMPDQKTVEAFAQTPGKYAGALATGGHTGDILGMNIRADRLPEHSRTPHQLLGLVGHELEHGQDAAKYGVAKHALEQPFDSSALYVPSGTLDQRLDIASRMHHIDSPEQTVEKTLLDRLATGEQIFPDLQQPVKRFTSDTDEINRLNNLIQQDPSLKDKLDQGMKMYDLQQNRPRFTKIRQGLK